MGLLSRLFGPKEPENFVPPSEDAKSAIMLIGLSGNYAALAKSLRSKNPHIRAFTVEAVLFAGRTQSRGGREYEFSLDAPLEDRAVQLLIPLLRDDDQKVRDAAEQGLKSARDNADAARALEEYHPRQEAPEQSTKDPVVVDGDSSNGNVESILAREAVSQDKEALKVVVLESGAQAGTVSNLLIRVHGVPKNQIAQLGPTLSANERDELLKEGRPIVLVSRPLINHQPCVFRKPKESDLLIAIQILDGELFSCPIIFEGTTFQFEPFWFR